MVKVVIEYVDLAEFELAILLPSFAWNSPTLACCKTLKVDQIRKIKFLFKRT